MEKEKAMYNVVMRTPECLVIDDFLPEEAQDKILNQVQVDEWEQTQGDDKFWHYTDGANYKNQKRWQGKYPYGDNCDVWFEHFNKFLNEYEHIGDYVEGGKFEDYAMRCHAYPVNSKNPWHSDLGFTTYTYYVHKDWQINWDSTLLIVPMGSVPEYSQWIELMEGTKHYDSYKELRSPMEMFQQKEKFQSIIDKGVGTFVSPKPNRLVLIQKNSVHGITRVDPDAGDNIRVTLTGAIGEVGWRDRVTRLADAEIKEDGKVGIKK